MNRFIILLASNDEAGKNISRACRILSQAFPENIRFSEKHWSAAVVKEGSAIPGLNSAKYLNMVCLGQSGSPLEEIRIFLKQAEEAFGRKRGPEACGCVAIDLDLVEWNGQVLRPKDAAQDYYKVCLKDLS